MIVSLLEGREGQEVTAWIGCTHNLWSPSFYWSLVNKACIIVYLILVFSCNVCVHVVVAKIKLRLLIPGPCLQTPGASQLNFWDLTAKFPELSRVSLSLMVHSVNWEKVTVLLISANQTMLRKTKQTLSTARVRLQHCSNLFWDPDLGTAQLCICILCYQCRVVHTCANLFPAYGICLEEAIMLLVLLVFTSCSNRMLLLVLLEKFKCP